MTALPIPTDPDTAGTLKPAARTCALLPALLLDMVPFCATKTTRYGIGGIEFLAKSGACRLSATDGRRLIVATWTDEGAPDVSTIIPRDALRAAKSPARSDAPVRLDLDEHGCIVLTTRKGNTLPHEPVDGTFPPVMDVIPPAVKAIDGAYPTNAARVVGFSSILLGEALNVMARIDARYVIDPTMNPGCVRFTWPTSPGKPIRIDWRGDNLSVVVVVMPVAI